MYTKLHLGNTHIVQLNAYEMAALLVIDQKKDVIVIKNTLALSLVCLSCSLPVMSGTMGDDRVIPPVYVGLFGGDGVIDGAYGQDGNFTQLRLSLGARAPRTYKNMQLGAEIGAQTGNTMRLTATEATIDSSGGLPVAATFKPLVDALVTLEYQAPSSPYGFFVKGGIAYRQLQLNNNTSIQDYISTINGEFQAGLGYRLSEHARLTAMYQGIYSSSNAGVQFTSTDSSGFINVGYLTISKIPTQNAGFIGVEYTY